MSENAFKSDDVFKNMASAVPFRVYQGTIENIVGQRTPVSESKLQDMNIVKTDAKYAGLPIFKGPSGGYLMLPLKEGEYVVILAYDQKPSST